MITVAHVWLVELAKTMHDLESEKKELVDDPEKLEVLFKEMIQMCLWYVLLCSFVVSLPDLSHILQGEMRQYVNYIYFEDL